MIGQSQARQTASEVAAHYRGRLVLVTGGLGFLGLNLIEHLARAGARVRVLHPAWPAFSGHLARLLEGVDCLKGDIRDETAVRHALADCQVVFNFAGRSGAAASNESPFDDLDVNVRGQLTFLRACGDQASGIKVVFPSSRLVYAPGAHLPLPESAPIGPISMYGIHKLAGENYHLLFHRLGAVQAVVLRVTNPYGPFQRLEQNRYGIVNWFIHRALRDMTLEVYGTGEQIRDYVHVDDVMDAFLRAGADPAANGKVFNVGSGAGVSFRRMAESVISAAGSGRVVMADWPPEDASVETGDFVADIGHIRRVLGWRPKRQLQEGIEEVVARYRAFEA